MARSSFNPFVDYNVPINKKGTRLGGSYMYGKSKVTSGDYKDFDLNANTHVFSTYISHPLIETQRAQLKLNTSANIKLSTADISGFQYTNYKDYNLAVGLGGRYNFNKSVLFGSLYSTNGIIQDDIRSYSQYFTKINADGYYIHYLPKGIIATVRTGGQYSPYNVPFLEQYQIGGISSVRGYSESLLLGGNSYFVSMEMLFPIPFLAEEIKIPFKNEGTFRLKDSIKLAAFMDNGAIIPNNGKTGTTNFLSSVGAGIRIAVSKFLTARVYVGVPLMNAGIYNQANARLHFDLIASPF
jgi:hemolysin activation/secretion protein